MKNQSFSLTEVTDIATAIISACEKNLRGLYHIAAPNYLSRYELANIYAKEMFGGYDKISEKEYAEIPFVDSRHIFGGLKSDKLQNILHIPYKDLNYILSNYKQSLSDSVKTSTPPHLIG